MSLLLGKFKNRTTGDESNRFIKTKDAFDKLILLCFGSIVATVVLQLFMGIGINRVASKPPPVLVQLKDGSSITVEPIDSLKRTDPSIQSFVNDTLTILFTWAGVIPGDETGQYVTDPGVTVVDGSGRTKGRVTTPAWQATYALELKFRQEFLLQLAGLVPESVFISKTNVAFVPIRILPPELVSPGKWKVPVYSNLLFVTSSNQIAEIVPYNVDVYVRAVPPSNAHLISQMIDVRSKPLAAIVANIRQAALQIDAIVPIKQEVLR